MSEWVAHNSDHANFLRRGIPSIRLLAGLNEEDSDCGFHLSPADTTDKVRREDLAGAAAVTARVLLAALDSESPPARTRTGAEAAALLPHYGFAPPPGSVERWKFFIDFPYLASLTYIVFSNIMDEFWL